MRNLSVLLIGMAVVTVVAGCAGQRSGVAAVADAMGATNLNSIQYSGSGFVYGFGQAYAPGDPWPRFFQNVYSASVNYQTPAMRLEAVRSQAETPPHGGAAQPVAGQQRTIQVVSGKYAWSEGGQQPTPNPAAVSDRLRQLWATPHGVIKAALNNKATIDGKNITFNVEEREVKVALNDQNLVERVQYLATNEVIGDFPIEVTYSDYADYGGVKFPTHIVETQDGHPTLDVTIREVKPNTAVTLEIPANVAQALAPPATPPVKVDKLANGVWYLNAAGVSSWAVEFKDHVVMVEGPFGEARSLAVNEAVQKAIPNKPIKYVVNTHAHYDHAGGLRTYVAQGATVVTHESNKAFFEQAWARPRTLAPDLLSKSPKPPVFETVSDKKVLTDGSRRLEIYHLRNIGHNPGMLIAYLPAEGLLYYGDGYNPPAGEDPRDPSRTPEYGIDLYRNITELNLKVARVAPTHSNRAVPYDNLKKAIGILPVVPAT
jgi:glyoxylase-like metal-dependent hydrolase (beta-lactamase superfamily II)